MYITKVTLSRPGPLPYATVTTEWERNDSILIADFSRSQIRRFLRGCEMFCTLGSVSAILQTCWVKRQFTRVLAVDARC